jgi:hypothetical protein
MLSRNNPTRGDLIWQATGGFDAVVGCEGVGWGFYRVGMVVWEVWGELERTEWQ